MSLVVPLIPLGPDPALLAPESAKDDIRRIAGDGGNTQDTVRELYRQYYEKKKKDLEAEQKRNEAEYTKDEKANVLTREASSEKPPSLGRRVKDVIKHALVI